MKAFTTTEEIQSPFFMILWGNREAPEQLRSDADKREVGKHVYLREIGIALVRAH
jgi:hypothetical protein